MGSSSGSTAEGNGTSSGAEGSAAAREPVSRAATPRPETTVRTPPLLVPLLDRDVRMRIISWEGVVWVPVTLGSGPLSNKGTDQ